MDRPATVLIVDDNTGVRKLTNAVLSRAGYATLTAENGRKGIDRFIEHADAIDLVVTDNIMPQLSGLEMVAEILRHRADVRVLFMSASLPDGLPVQYANRFRMLAKPFVAAELLAAVEACLRN